MKHKFTTLALCSALMLSTSVAYAGNTPRYLTGGHAFIGAGVGYGTILTGMENFHGKIFDQSLSGFQDGGLAWKINGGYLWYVQNSAWGVELAYSVYPSTRIFSALNLVSGEVEASGIDMLGVAKLFFTPQFNIGVKAGVTYMTQKLDFRFNVPGHDPNLNVQFSNGGHFFPMTSVGLSYLHTQHFSTNIEFQYVFGPKKFKDELDKLRKSPITGIPEFFRTAKINNFVQNPAFAVLVGLTYSI